ncbi:hypothetical protein PoB_002360400 [Plakobranchus ocellatus]|uniref:B box-type domain-containing protein n=1 Tax=Plakobranchus ocellatus TaxID=259542 RepID=A0AAV3ZRS3_9GAST|nr:hypothetical protein PoB_002360400 [Plakobranchus ocellatus]
MDNMEGNQPSSSQEDDMIPLSKLQNRISTDAGSSDEDIPLADLRRTGSPISDFDNSDADPEYKPGQCEVKHCREEVWAACENCLMLVCYDHCIEDIDSCEHHGKTMKNGTTVKKKRRNKAKDIERKGKLYAKDKAEDMGILEDHIHHENQDDASIEEQAEQENHDLLPRPQQGRELQEEGKAERENREDDIRVDANDENLQKQ